MGCWWNAEHRMNLRLTLMENRKALAINHAVQKGKCFFSLYSPWSSAQGGFWITRWTAVICPCGLGQASCPTITQQNQPRGEDKAEEAHPSLSARSQDLIFLICQVLGESARPIMGLNQPVWEPWESPCLLLVKNSSMAIKQEYLWLWCWTQSNRVDDVSGWFAAEILHLDV